MGAEARVRVTLEENHVQPEKQSTPSPPLLVRGDDGALIQRNGTGPCQAA